MDDNNVLRFAGAYRDKVITGPKYVTLHLTNMCNLKCVYCWYHSDLTNVGKKNKQEMKFDLFKKLIDEFSELGVEMVSFSGEGEPFLHPKIGEMISYVKENNMKLAIFTNGTFNRDMIKFFSNIDSLSVNLSSLSPENYSFLQDGDSIDNFEKVIKNLRFLSELKKHKRSEKPRIELVFIINKKNFNEITHVFDFAKKLKFDVCFRLMKTREEIKNLRIDKKQASRIKKSLEEVIKREKGCDIDTNAKDLYETLKNPFFLKEKTVFYPYDKCYRNFYYSEIGEGEFCCYIGWYFAIVHISGDTFLCCHNPNLKIGNVSRKSFRDIWFSEIAKGLRLKCKYEFDIKKNFWTECHMCSFVDFNKEIKDRIKNLDSKSIKKSTL